MVTRWRYGRLPGFTQDSPSGSDSSYLPPPASCMRRRRLRWIHAKALSDGSDAQTAESVLANIPPFLSPPTRRQRQADSGRFHVPVRCSKVGCSRRLRTPRAESLGQKSEKQSRLSLDRSSRQRATLAHSDLPGAAFLTAAATTQQRQDNAGCREDGPHDFRGGK